MATKKPCVMLILAVVAVVLLNRAAMAQQVSLGNQYSKANLQRGTTRSGPSRLKVLRPAPNTNERPKQTEIEKEFAAAARVMASYKQWMIGANATGFVYPNTTSGPASKKYNLKGLVNKKFLQYEKQGTFGGINLGWTQTASAGTAIDRAQWIFQRPGGPSEQLAPLVYGEPIALGWSKGSNPFLKYAKRNVGINLDWSDAVFEWTILGRTPGTNVGRGQDVVILYNLKHQMPPMRFDRTKGGDIGWPDSTRWSAKSVFHSPDYLASFRKAADVMMGK
ncbi:hypothetical protein [Bythopirellula goksoeyrii]|uniref:Uncharacterized protein n=1 Tax=Bythopirellula goksoeyrii TaxID=1400387 RepID=A0A5B9Q864_9BACT|nr:hypothetical protein [Bythopirellula goksoeyrii]QEG33765.1 hypothetical protein Pr1d_10350 [Bythopirellula goksoeyrii]